MGSATTNTRVRMMAAGSSSGTMLAVNLTLIPAGRRVRGTTTKCALSHFQILVFYIQDIKRGIFFPFATAF